MRNEIVDWLVCDTRDTFDADEVGLYEFIWGLRGKFPGLSRSEMEACSQEALAILLQQKLATLVWLTWPHSNSTPAPNEARFQVGAWDDPAGDAPYLAVTRAEEIDSLARVVLDRIESGCAGLHEFVRWLQNNLPSLSEDERIAYAQEAVKLLLRHGSATLVWMTSPGGTPMAARPQERFENRAWTEPLPETPYLAVMRKPTAPQ